MFISLGLAAQHLCNPPWILAESKFPFSQPPLHLCGNQQGHTVLSGWVHDGRTKKQGQETLVSQGHTGLWQPSRLTGDTISI